MRFGLYVIIALIVAMMIPDVAFHLFYTGKLWNGISDGKLLCIGLWYMLCVLGAVDAIIIEYRHKKKCGSKPGEFPGKVNMMSTRWPLLFGLGEAFIMLLIITWLPNGLILSLGVESPILYAFPLVSLIIPTRNAMNIKWRRFAGNIIGLLLASPIALVGLLYLALIIMGVPPH